jgi:hypothetical protein
MSRRVDAIRPWYSVPPTLLMVVGAAGFEPAISWSRIRRLGVRWRPPGVVSFTYDKGDVHLVPNCTRISVLVAVTVAVKPTVSEHSRAFQGVCGSALWRDVTRPHDGNPTSQAVAIAGFLNTTAIIYPGKWRQHAFCGANGQ